MPFDGIQRADFAGATANERLLMLADELNAEALKVRKWDFDLRMWNDECGTSGCALGLADHIYPIFKNLRLGNGYYYPTAEEIFGMSKKEVLLLFGTNQNIYGKRSALVDGGDVAEAIRSFVGNRRDKIA